MPKKKKKQRKKTSRKILKELPKKVIKLITINAIIRLEYNVLPYRPISLLPTLSKLFE